MDAIYCDEFTVTFEQWTTSMTIAMKITVIRPNNHELYQNSGSPEGLGVPGPLVTPVYFKSP
jgi:hypothetical protein